MSRHAVATSAITPVELASALRRRREAGDVTTSALRAVQARVRRERAEWALRLPNKAVLDRAERLAERLPVRVLDAIHLASALLFNDEAAVLTPFFTADERQRHAAIALGLDVHFVE